jgi:cysteinyl-tRNA synthetase
MDEVLGILELARSERADVSEELAEWVAQRIEHRQDARGRRDFAAADRIRDELSAAGITVEDTPLGPRWKKR